MGLIRFVLIFIVAYIVWRWLVGIMGLPGRRSVPPPAPGPRQLSPYEILGITPAATSGEIRDAYQKLVKQYHPDQVAHLGPELREVAERRTKEITAAYNQIKRS